MTKPVDCHILERMVTLMLSKIYSTQSFPELMHFLSFASLLLVSLKSILDHTLNFFLLQIFFELARSPANNDIDRMTENFVLSDESLLSG